MGATEKKQFVIDAISKHQEILAAIEACGLDGEKAEKYYEKELDKYVLQTSPTPPATEGEDVAGMQAQTVILKDRAENAEAELARLKGAVEKATVMADAVWAINKRMPFFSNQEVFGVSREELNRLFAARVDFDNYVHPSKEQALSVEGGQ